MTPISMILPPPSACPTRRHVKYASSCSPGTAIVLARNIGSTSPASIAAGSTKVHISPDSTLRRIDLLMRTTSLIGARMQAKAS